MNQKELQTELNEIATMLNSMVKFGLLHESAPDEIRSIFRSKVLDKKEFMDIASKLRAFKSLDMDQIFEYTFDELTIPDDLCETISYIYKVVLMCEVVI